MKKIVKFLKLDFADQILETLESKNDVSDRQWVSGTLTIAFVGIVVSAILHDIFNLQSFASLISFVGWIENFFLNFGTEAIGVLISTVLTVAVIEFRNSREREQDRTLLLDAIAALEQKVDQLSAQG